jgi:hypothetical protein
MNTVNNRTRETFTLKRPVNYCETVKIIKAKTKIDILFNKHIFHENIFIGMQRFCNY